MTGLALLGSAGEALLPETHDDDSQVAVQQPSLPAPDRQCDTSLFQKLLPPFAPVSAQQLIATAKRRSEDVLENLADEIWDLRWQVDNARLNGQPIPSHLHPGILQERHHAINWIMRTDDVPWDEVRTDT